MESYKAEKESKRLEKEAIKASQEA